MAMPKKGARKITVDDELYYWRIWVDESDYLYGHQKIGYKSIIIESETDNRYQIVGGFECAIDFVITPGIVRQIICQAIENGWKPGVSKERHYGFDPNSIAIPTVALWKPDFFDGEQVLIIGADQVYYFNDKDGLQFSWGAYNALHDFKASCAIITITHKVYGVIDKVVSHKNNFVIIGTNFEKRMTLDEMLADDWTLRVELENYLELPKKNN